MNRFTTLLLLSCLPACSTTAAGVKDPEGYTAEQRRRDALNKQIAADSQFVPRIMQGLDKAIDKYFAARAAAPDRRAQRLRDTLEQSLRHECRKNFDLLIMKAEDHRDRAHRGIALVALGFADDTETRFRKAKDGMLTKQQIAVRNAANGKLTEMALNALTTALRDPEDAIVDRALLGLGLLAHQDTPLAEIGDIVEDSKRSLDLRRNASWALTTMQDKLTPEKRLPIRPIFQRLLSQPLGEVEAPVVCHAIHTLGHFRNALDAKIVEPYTRHPTALVRVRAAIALGQIKNESSVPALLELIKDKETNQNVRLAAHKSLKALAGGRDRGYDVEAWKKLFTYK